MWIFTPFILGGMLLFAFILGSVGVLCTHDRRDFVPGLLFGLPAIVLSLSIFVLFMEVDIIWAGFFAIPSMVIGSLVVWRGFRTGHKWSDYFSAILVCGGIFLMGFVLVKYSDITRTIFSHILPAAPKL
jgi:hypothetical protein